jgi:hypothetical protein
MNSLLKSKIIKVISLLPEIYFAAISGSFAENCNCTDGVLDIAIDAECPMSYKENKQIKNNLSVNLDKEINFIDLNVANGLTINEALCRCSCGIIVKKILHNMQI